ncbi:hypothetical protein Q8A73_010346 [Channa argus]|nr:hypothetical protein Q8A73_010346 [Channa argus]
MDPADTNHLQRAVSSQGARLGQHDQQLRWIEEGVVRYTQQLSQVGDTLKALCSHVTLSAASPEPLPPPQLHTAPATPESYVPPPEPFSGALNKCRGFLLQCRLARWDNVALRAVFRHGLSDLVKDELANRDPPDSLDEFINLAICVDNHIRERRREREQKPAPAPQNLCTPPLLESPVSPGISSSASPEGPAEPMELARARLSPTERQRRFQAAPFPNRRSPPTDTSPTLDMSLIPPAYHDIAPVFNKEKALSLPPHHPFDCAIDLQAGAPLPTAGFFFVSKKDKTLRPCIDYRGLNNITIKNKYPLPLLNSAFETLQDAAIFTKLDLRNAYHLVRIREGDGRRHSTHHCVRFIIGEGEVRPDPEKTRAVTEWPRPGTRKQLQRFLGFANFYRRFIKNYSTVAAPLTKLTSPVAPFHWTEKAKGAFTRLKELFTSPPILSQPDTSRQFIVEVDASEIGVGAVLSQRSEGDQKLRPCTFFSRQLSPAERNYSVGDRELLVIKLALEQWRHWLEGALQPFIIWTEHKNLAHLRTAKRLNSRQARWFFFFDRFDFSLTYRPGSKNVKPDALSHIHAPETSSNDPKPILRLSCVLGALTWEIEQTVRTAQQQEPDPGTGPPGLLFVPSQVRSQVLQWVHCSKFSCHPGADRSINLLRRHFWWPSLVKDTREFVVACATCARGKTPKTPPNGLLQPLPIPSCPWSHNALDFVTGLPPSHGNTTILTIVDCFSKAVHFVPLPKLPTAKETAQLLTQHVLRLHGIPHDIVPLEGGGTVTAPALPSSTLFFLSLSVRFVCLFLPSAPGLRQRPHLHAIICPNDSSSYTSLLYTTSRQIVSVTATNLRPPCRVQTIPFNSSSPRHLIPRSPLIFLYASSPHWVQAPPIRLSSPGHRSPSALSLSLSLPVLPTLPSINHSHFPK